MAFEYIISIPQVTKPRVRVEGFLPIAQTGGAVELEDGVTVLGSFELEAHALAYKQESNYTAIVEVYKDQHTIYQSGNTLLKYLPAECSVQDTNGDLKDFLQVVAITFDEFYGFIDEFTTLFDPDRCPAKYLPYLAKLINYPLNTRGFDSEVPSLKDAAVRRARLQLRTAVDVYKRKGLKEAFQILFYGLGYYIELVELWTNNYVSFHAEIPANESEYHPISNPTGWFKSPYFGIKLVSLNQQTVETIGGEGQPGGFNPEDLQEILEAIHSIRPVHTVLWWLEYFFDMVDRFDQWNDVPEVSFIEGVPDDRIGYTSCDPDDPVYIRDDPRLVGVTRQYAPQTNPALPGPTVAAAMLKRQQFRGLCHPNETLITELSQLNWADEKWCTAVYRRAGEQYRDGFNTSLRDGSQGSRDPSAFGGRNGYYRRDTPLAPFPSSLVPDRSGCYLLDDSVSPLYQIAEEAEDGITRYFNTYEFHNYLDTIVTGMGIDPDMSPGSAFSAAFTRVSTAPVSVAGNGIAAYGDDVWSMFGESTLGGAALNQLVRLNFVSGLLNAVTLHTPTGAASPRTRGFAAALATSYLSATPAILYFGGKATGSGDATSDVSVYNIATNAATTHEGVLNFDRAHHAGAVVGNNVYLVGGINALDAPLNNIEVFNASSGPGNVYALPFDCANPAAVAVNEYVYIYADGQLWRFNTVTNTSTFVSLAPGTTTQPCLIAHGSFLYLYSATNAWDDSFFDADSLLEFHLPTSTWSIRRVSRNNGGATLCQTVPKFGRFYGAGSYRGLTPTNAVQVLTF